MSKFDLFGATAVISGASSGLGLEISSLLCEKYGCRVIGLARGEERLRTVADELGENFIPFVCDVTHADDRRRLLTFLADKGIKPDILINNAGMLPRFAAFEPDKLDELYRVTQLNYLSAVEMCAAFLPLLLESEHGAIVNVASSAALASLPGTSAYSASKSALLAFTQSLSLEYGKNLYISCVCPGMTATELFSEHENSNLVSRIASPADRAARKIVAGLRKRRKKIVIGADAHIMSVGYRLFGTSALGLFAAFLRSVKLPIFSESFYKKRK